MTAQVLTRWIVPSRAMCERKTNVPVLGSIAIKSESWRNQFIVNIHRLSDIQQRHVVLNSGTSDLVFTNSLLFSAKPPGLPQLWFDTKWCEIKLVNLKVTL